MANNYLEQLVSEWYEYKGYFLRRNVLAGKLAAGGYECELDIVAFHPGKKHLIHIEASMDTLSWDKREAKYAKKFTSGNKHIHTLFEGLDLPKEIDQVVLLVYASKANHTDIGGGRILLASELLTEIINDLKSKPIHANIIPEHLTILRSLQFVAYYKKDVIKALSETN